MDSGGCLSFGGSRRRRGLRVLAVGVVALVAATIMAPAGATVTSVSAGGATVTAGNAVSITIITTGPRPSIQGAGGSGIGVGVAREGVEREGGTAAWPATFQTFVTTPPGTYEFTISDANGVWPGSPFVLTVTPPATTTTVPTTPTTVAGPDEPEPTTTVPAATPTTAPAPREPTPTEPEPTEPEPTPVVPGPPERTTTTTTTTTTMPPTTTTVTLVPPGFGAQGPGGGSQSGEFLPWIAVGAVAVMFVAAAAAVVTAYSGFDLRMAIARRRLNRSVARRGRIGPARSVTAWWRAGVRGRKENGLPPPDGRH